jgi:hypothetical protein
MDYQAAFTAILEGKRVRREAWDYHQGHIYIVPRLYRERGLLVYCPGFTERQPPPFDYDRWCNPRTPWWPDLDPPAMMKPQTTGS